MEKIKKKRLVKLISLMLILCLSCTYFACGGGDNGENPPPVVCEKHDYQVKEDRPHLDPEAYGTVVMECTKCKDSYEQKYFGHSIKGCDLAPLFNQRPANIEECAYCHDISNHTCP